MLIFSLLKIHPTTIWAVLGCFEGKNWQVGLKYSIKTVRSIVHIEDNLIFYRPDPVLLPFDSINIISKVWMRENYIEIPLKIGYTTGKKWNYFINTAIVPGIYIFSKYIQHDIAYPSEEVHKSSSKGSDGFMRRFSLGIMLETGTGYNWNNFFVYASVNGQCSILPIDKESTYPFVKCTDRYYSFGFNIGIKYRLQKENKQKKGDKL